MEKLLHYVWKHHLLPMGELTTSSGQCVEVIDPGLHNTDAGPDFFNAKVRIDGQLWVGNVECHVKSAEWYQHKHHEDEAYNNVILHVCCTPFAEAERPIVTQDGKTLEEVFVPIPSEVESNYRELLAEESYPPCYKVIPHIPMLTVHAWMSALTVERLEQKTLRVKDWIDETKGDWERVFFITLARNFGFGVNSDAFERWAASLNPQHICKHRDNLFQIETFFLGQAGLLDKVEEHIPENGESSSITRASEWKFLQNKFTLTPMEAKEWRYLRMRPQNFPHQRIMQLAEYYHNERLNFSMLREATDVSTLRDLFKKAFESDKGKHLSDATLDLLLINTVAPILFCYGQLRYDERMTERALELLESVVAEENNITRSWELAGLTVHHAADSQALIQLRRQYCDRKDCLRCRFGAEYLRKKN